jgi:hypothetical protein
MLCKELRNGERNATFMEVTLDYIISGDSTLMSGAGMGTSGTLFERTNGVQHAIILARHMLDRGFLNVQIKNKSGDSIGGDELLEVLERRKRLSENLRPN